MANIQPLALDLSRILDSQPLSIDFRSKGRSGLRTSGGQIFEDDLPEMQGLRASAIFKAMVDNDATCGTIINVIDKMVRGVAWPVQRVSDHPRDRAAADFIEECLEDMDQTWSDTVSEMMTMLVYGFSLHEVVLKRRAGNAEEPHLHSKFSDGRIGWRGMPIRAQESISQWVFDDLGNLINVVQCPAPTYQMVTMPMEKLLLFRTSTHKNSPVGRSIFRPAFKSWKLKRSIENSEAVGIERDICGLPVARIPGYILAGTTPEEMAQAEAWRTITSNVRNDEQAGMVIPSDRDDNGNYLYEFNLLTSGGARSYNTDAIIARHSRDIAMSAMADFIYLGAGANASGSWAMHEDKTSLFLQACGTYLDIIQDTLNRFAIPRLLRLNTFQISEYPTLKHDKLEKVNLKDVGEFVRNICQAGAPLFPNEEIEEKLCAMADLPPPVMREAELPGVDPLGTTPSNNINEVHEGDPDPINPAAPNVAEDFSHRVL